MKDYKDSYRMASSEDEMRVGLGHVYDPTESQLRFTKQIGIDDILVTAYEDEGFDSYLPRGKAWTVEELVVLRNLIEEYGLRMFGIESLPIPVYDILIDETNRDEKIGVVKDSIRSMGDAGIRVLGYSGHPPCGVYRTSRDMRLRGGAVTSAFDYDEVRNERAFLDREYSEEELWARYEDFLQQVIPVAEESEVTLALHNSEPPVEEIAQIPVLFRSTESIERALSMMPSENHGLKFDVGGFSEMGDDVVSVIQQLGVENIAYVHFRDVVGTVPEFYETFLDDPDGNQDELAILQELYDSGFDGVVTPDHIPTIIGEEEWHVGGYHGRAFTAGYIKGLLRTIKQ